MSRNYDNTGETQGVGSCKYLRLNGKEGKIFVQAGQEKREVPGFSGYIDGFKFYDDPGNPEHQVAAHKGITIFLSGKDPATGEVAKFKLDQGINNVIIAPSLINALLGAEADINSDTVLYLSVWSKEGKPRITININGVRPNNRFPYDETERWFKGVPRAKEVINPVTNLPVKVWHDFYAFWAQQAEQFVHRMSSRFGQPDATPVTDVPDDAFEGFEDMPAFEATPEPEIPDFAATPTEEPGTMGAAAFKEKIGKVKQLQTGEQLIKAYTSMIAQGMTETQLRQAKGLFIQAATILKAKITFTDTGATLDEDLNELPF